MALRAGAAPLALFSDEGERLLSDEGKASACTVNRKRRRSDMLGKIKGEERTSSKLERTSKQAQLLGIRNGCI